MNKALIMTLMVGTHRCVYSGSTGDCIRCGKHHSPHEFQESVCLICGQVCVDHEWDSTTGLCKTCGNMCAHQECSVVDNYQHSCNLCKKIIAHSFQNSECTCGHVCTHEDGYYADGFFSHRCRICNTAFSHVLVPTQDPDTCKICRTCGETRMHECPLADAEMCGTCVVCGDDCGKHMFGIDRCMKCGYKCQHQKMSENCTCVYCGKDLTKPDSTYHVLAEGDDLPYRGSYEYAGNINGQKYYRQYIGSTNGTWTKGEYFLVEFNVLTPTSFGGEYAYTVEGAIFTKNLDSVAINSTLLTGDGKYQIFLVQYSNSGEIIASGRYTSEDCKNMKGRLPGG